jgi:CIC family chloride channel protein
MVGILSANDVRQMVEDSGVGVVITGDIATADVVTVDPTTDLESALQRFVSLDVGALPIVDPGDPQRLLGMLSRRHVIRAYDDARRAWRERCAGEQD